MARQVKDKIDRPEMGAEGLHGQIMGVASDPDNFRNLHPGMDFSEGAAVALRCLTDWGLLSRSDTHPPLPGDFPAMAQAEIVAAMVTAAGYYSRPNDLGYEISEVAAYGITSYSYMSDQGIVVMRNGGLSFSFTTGLPALDSLIGSLLMQADQISTLMVIAHAARRDGSVSSFEVEEALAKLKWRFGDGKPTPKITALKEDEGEKMVLRLASRIWVKMGFYRQGGPFEQAEGSPAYNDCITMARETLS
jgi:hypothetical protein